MSSKTLDIYFKNNSLLFLVLYFLFWSYIAFIFFLMTDFTNPEQVSFLIMVLSLLFIMVFLLIINYIRSLYDKLTISSQEILYDSKKYYIKYSLANLKNVYYCYILNEKIKSNTVRFNRFDLHPYLVLKFSNKTPVKMLGDIRYPKITNEKSFKDLYGYDFKENAVFINIENTKIEKVSQFFHSIGYQIDKHKPLIDTEEKKVYNEIVDAYFYGEDIEIFRIK